MNITFMLFYYDPENPTINYLYRPLWEELIAQGHHINIITPNPTRGIPPHIQKEYLRANVEEREHMTIYRVPAYTYQPHKFSKFKLFRRYVSVSRRLTKQLKRVNSDVIFVSTNPPLLYSYLVTRYAAKKDIPVVYNVQDIYPDNLFKESSLFYKLFNPLQTMSLRRATHIITISETMRNTLLNKGDFNDKISVVHNFDISDVENAKDLPVRYFEKDKCNIVYAGNIGYVQDVDVILAAAKLLLHDPHFAFHIFGEGSQADRIAKRIRDENIVNTTYYPALSVEESGALYKNADINLISILPRIIKTALPLKTASVLAAHKPIIFIGLDIENHQEEWVKMASNLTVVNDRNYIELSEQIKKLNCKHNSIEFSKNSSPFFTKNEFVNKYTSIIINCKKSIKRLNKNK